MLFRSHLWGATYPLDFTDVFWVWEAGLILPQQLCDIITIEVSIEGGWHAIHNNGTVILMGLEF
jgi:hypothetical protein